MASAGTKEIKPIVKQSVRAVLLSKIDGVLLSKFCRDYRNLLEEPVPYVDHGYRNLETFLRALPDVVRFEYSQVNQDWRLYGIGDPNTYMSGHAKKAQGKPGHDVDKLDEKRKRSRGSRYKSPQGKSNYRQEQTIEDPSEPMLIAGHKGLYSLCCVLFDNNKEDILKDFRAVANVVETSLSKCYLFTRYSSKKDALNILKTFSSKYSVRPAMDRMNAQKENRDKPKGGNSQLTSLLDLGKEATNAPRGKRSSEIIEVLEIYIGNIPKDWNESHILHLLDGLQVGNLRIKTKDTNRFAFGSLSREDALDAVERLHNKLVQNRRMTCRLAHPDPMKAGHGTEVARGNLETVTNLVKMGFPLEGARRAVYYSGDKGLGEAIVWIKQHQDDHDFNKPFTIPKTSENSSVSGGSPQGSRFKPNQTALALLMSQGVTVEQATRALEATNNNRRSAEAWIIEHIEELASGMSSESVGARGDAGSSSGANSGSCSDAMVREMGDASPSSRRGVGARLSDSFSKTFQPDPEAVETLLSYGLPKKKILQALEATNNDLEEAANWIILNTDDLREALDNLDTRKTETISDSSGEMSKKNIQDTQKKTVENGGHEAKETQNAVPSKPGQNNANNDDDDDDDDLPSLEDDDDIPELEDDSEDVEGSLAGTDSLSLESDGQKVSIFVGNFPYGTSQVDLLEIFAEYEPSKITMVNNSDHYRNTYAFLVLPNGDVAERAIMEMSEDDTLGYSLAVGMAYIDRGYNDPSDDEEETFDSGANGETEIPDSPNTMPDSVEMFDNLTKTLWPHSVLLENGLYGILEVYVTCVVNDYYFYGHVIGFKRDMIMLSKINEQLNGVCSRRPPEKKTPMYRCAAVYEENWYRAYNMGAVGSGEQQAVLFVDFGNIESVSVKEIRRPDMRFWEHPAVAKPFQLAVGSLKDFPDVEGKTVTIKVIPKEEDEEWNSVTNCLIMAILDEEDT